MTATTAQHQAGAKHRSASSAREMKAAAKAQRKANRGLGVKIAIAAGWTLGGVLTVGIVAAAVWGFSLLQLGLGAKDHLEAAKDKVEDVVDLAKDRDIEGINRTFAEIVDHTEQAVALTKEWAWEFGESLPIALISENLVAVREVAQLANDVVVDAAPFVEEFSPLLNTANLKSPDGGFNLAPLERARDLLPEITAIFDNAAARTVQIGRGEHVLGLLTEELDKLDALFLEAKPLLDEANELLPSVLPLLGAEGKRNYLLLFQNNAEVRALGGLPAAVALISVDKGKVKLVRQASTPDFHACCRWSPNLELPAEVSNLYPDNMTRILGDVTMRPDFPTAAKLATNMWKKRFDERVDAVISIDPVTLGYFLEATGPIKVNSKDTISADNAIKLLLSEIYTRYEWYEGALMDKFFADVAKKVFDALAGGDDDEAPAEPVGLSAAVANLREEAKKIEQPFFLRAFARVINTVNTDTSGDGVDYVELIKQAFKAAEENRVFAYSPKKEEAALIERFGLSGTMRKSNEEFTQVGVYFNDSSVSKLSYYLRASIEVVADRCPDNGKRGTITTKVTIRSLVPKDAIQTLPIYVKANAGTLKRTGHADHMRVSTLVYAARGANFTSVPSSSGYAAGIYDRSGKDLGRAVEIVDTTLGPGEKRTLTFVQRLPNTTELGPVEIDHTGMLKDTPVTITEKSSCPNDPPVEPTEPTETPDAAPETDAAEARRND